MNPVEQKRFWLFDHDIDEEFQTPSIDKLITTWQDTHRMKTFALSNNHFGIYQAPVQTPSAVISLDLCEVVRETGLSFEKIHGGAMTPERLLRTQNEMAYNALYSNWMGADVAHDNLQRLAQQLMHHDHVSPVPYHEGIQALLQKWQSQNVYIIANTSTLPGCEVSTIKFLADTYPGSFSGILFPRNHDGSGTTTKASILENFKHSSGVHTITDLTTVAIEDVAHHSRAYVEASSDTEVFMPAYIWNEELEDTPRVHRISQGFGTLDTFLAVDQYLASRGIVK